MARQTTPYGSWTSPITPQVVTAGGRSFSMVRFDGDRILWSEGRPEEKGRQVICTSESGDQIRELIPEEASASSRVHEYGSGAYVANNGRVFYVEESDQRIYRSTRTSQGKIESTPITPEPDRPAGVRYADMDVSPDGAWIYAVRETHGESGEPVNDLVRIPADGSAPPKRVAGGHDFYSFPRVSPDGRTLAFTTWDHPQMPWDGTELWLAEITDDGIEEVTRVAGGPEESVFQPQWHEDGTLYFVSDRTDWWNVYRRVDGKVEPVTAVDAEIGTPQWVFGLSHYAFLSKDRMACIVVRNGLDHLAIVDLTKPDAQTGHVMTEIPFPYTYYGRGGTIVSDGKSRLAFVVASSTEAPAVAVFDVPDALGTHARLPESIHILRNSGGPEIDSEFLSRAVPIEFPTTGDRTAHALYYPPASRDHKGPDNERPPLIVKSHGGPTAYSTSELSYAAQFWSSRGFALVDVNYGGSTGYGRPYRERLKGTWGIVDVDDCIAAAKYLEAEGKVDGKRMAIRGGSAGGFTTLCALVFHDVFAAGASHYGVAELEALARDTHKFEARYMDGLIGPYPERKDLYYERSPVHFVDRLSCPVILLQGSEDKVVPPSQAEAMVEAMKSKGLPHAYVVFEGERHGFRQAANIHRALEAEYLFYAKVFGFQPADDFAPLEELRM